MEEIDQINEFVQEVGDDIEVQWGASIDETLGEEVRVTIIATGYKVDGLPTEDEEAINDAIDSNYPPITETPREDEQMQTIDLSGTLFPVEEPTRASREHVTSSSADDVVITIEDDDNRKPEQPQSHRPFEWIRRK